MKAISTVLKMSLLSDINFAHCWSSNQVTTNLTYLIEGLCRRSLSSIRLGLDLSGNITTEHAHYLVLLLTACPLHLFQLSHTDIRQAMPLIAEALKHNVGLRQIFFSGCNIGDRSLLHLGKALQVNKTVALLVVDQNLFSSSAVKAFLRSQFSSGLLRMDIGRALNEEEIKVYRDLLYFRTQNKLPRLDIANKMAPHINAIIASAATMLSLPMNVVTRSELLKKK